MALSFSFPAGKVKKIDSDSCASRESTDHSYSKKGNLIGQFQESNNENRKGPTSWKSFPSLSFFKDSSNNVKVPSSTHNIISKLPIRTSAFSSTFGVSCSTKSGSNSSSSHKDKKGVNSTPTGLILENLTSTLRGCAVNKSLPDVTDTESPQPLTSHQSEKPCDLLAQLESLSKNNTQNSKEFDHVENKLGNPRKMDEEDQVSRSFDDNGNPCAPPQVADQGKVHEQAEESDSGNREGIEYEADIRDGQGPSHYSHPHKTAESDNMNRSIHGIDSESTEIKPMHSAPKATPEPKYFIDAAALSEDVSFLPMPVSPLPSPSPSSSNFADMTLEQNRNLQKQKSEEVNTNKSDKELFGQLSMERESSLLNSNHIDIAQKAKEVSVIRPRVPVSKSYPDIIQTTFNNDEQDMVIMTRPIAKENSDLESLVADSLENLALTPSPSGTAFTAFSKSQPISQQVTPEVVSDKPLKAFDKPFMNPSSAQINGSNMSGSSMMTESQMGGLFAEKPPEAWVIDFNSISIDSEIETAAAHEAARKSNSGSNSNSLAFFVTIDDQENQGSSNATGRERKNSDESLFGPEKKMFSMFVDIREGEGRSSASSSSNLTSIPQMKKPPVVNKHVMNIMETSGSSGKSMSRKYPSPIFQHKAAAEAARQAARMEWEKQREKYFDSLEPSTLMMMPNMNMGSLMGNEHNNEKHRMGESTSSNRSSLHVANVLESSFSSSFISSMETSQPEEMEICQGGPCLKLGKDLLRMFQEGINTDVNINVNGKWIKAHKCILASRSQYFAAILSGHWVEKAGNTINLDGFSYSVVQFTLYHIYSGTNEIPDTIDLLELATLTDLLGLEGLRENISQTFRVKFCHNFHRPCTGCITGVLECFPIAAAYGMDELNRKMIKWICKHFVRIWPTKGFAGLGDELNEKCLRYSINHLSTDNILDHTLGCDQLSTTMPSLRWTEVIFNLVNQLAEECVQFLGENLSDVLQSQKFLQFGKGQAWNISRIEGTFVKAMDLLKPDVACMSHTALTRLIELGTETIQEVEWSTSFVDFLRMLRDYVERYLLANASKAVLSRCWEQLGNDFKKKVCSTSFVGYDKYGNKIVKNTGSGSHTSGSNSKAKASRPSSSSSNRTSSRNPLSKQTSVPVKPIQSVVPCQPSSIVTKVASVRPMQSQQQNVHPTTSTVAEPTQKRFSGRTVSSAKSGSDYETRSSPPIATPRNASTLRAKAISVEREKSFNSRRASISTASSTASANRTPIKPLTPSVPSKPSPLTGYDQGIPFTTSTRTTKSTVRSQKPPEPPKKIFVSNSAKAAAVSKPLLKSVSKKNTTPSISSINSQPNQTSTAQRSANVSQSSRYLSTTTSSTARTEGFSARSSFSNTERPQAVKSKVDSIPPRRNTYGQAKQTTIPSKIAKRPISGTSVEQRPDNRQSSASGHSSMPHALPSATVVSDFSSLNESYNLDNVMSRSTVETESGEVKMRTLAEIGRSSTFSKDEPTILKMDGSGYGNFDMAYDEYDS